MKILRKIYKKLDIGYYKSKVFGHKILESRICNRSKHLFLLSHGIGDVVWSMAYLSEYLLSKNIGIEEVCIVACKRDEAIIRCWFPEVEIICLEKKHLYYAGVYVSAHKWPNNSVKALIYPELEKPRKMIMEIEPLSKIGMEMDHCYKYGCYDLDESADIQLPISNYAGDTDFSLDNSKVKPRESVILVPYVNSRMAIPIDFWERLAAVLKSKGLHVYTNVGNESDDPIRHTERLAVTLEVLPKIVKHGGCVISGRCGLADWLFLNECPMVIVHSYKNNNETLDDFIQSSFGRKESFFWMKERCHLSINIAEHRVCIDDYNEKDIQYIVNSGLEILGGSNNAPH